MQEHCSCVGVMTYWRIRLGVPTPSFCFDHIFCLHPRSIAAQELDPTGVDRSCRRRSFSMFHGDELQPARQDLTGDSLPDALAGRQAQGQAQNPRRLRVPTNQLAVLAANAKQHPLDGARQLSDLYHKSFGRSRDSASTWRGVPNA